jgi:hypothetical protein
MRASSMLFLIALICLPACSEDAAPPRDDVKPEPVLTLPEEFLGEWEATGTSGGLDGKGIPVPEGSTPARVVITAENTIERRGPDGKVVTQRFTVRKGKTIFSAEDLWAIRVGDMEQVIQIGPDGSLGMSENVYDGYSTSYRRVN